MWAKSNILCIRIAFVVPLVVKISYYYRTFEELNHMLDLPLGLRFANSEGTIFFNLLAVRIDFGFKFLVSYRTTGSASTA
ncbi:hypothetical protein L1987_49024 [Smallanthus sonchifolius]|uniref:Uncharacterized protein n=1 Tax=Smallanthus sonchifolius TaxID=185202 RepID=A0ACB9FUL9_9ASTR|nr:hypothetical protein L1987_49024 [Smallanthus sonchifolius]